MLPWSLVNINSRGITKMNLQRTHLQSSTKDQISAAEAKGFSTSATAESVSIGEVYASTPTLLPVLDTWQNQGNL